MVAEIGAQAAVEREDRFRTLVTSSPVGIFECEPDGACVFVNTRLCDLSGRSDDAFAGHAWIDVVHPDDRERVVPHITSAMAQGLEWKLECRLLRPDETVAWIVARATPLRDASGTVRSYLGTVEDVTDRKHAEDTATAAAARFEAVLANLSDVVAVIDAHGTMTFVSNANERISGRRAEDRHGRSVFDFVHPDDVGRAAESFMQAMATPGLYPMFEVRIQHENGSYRTLEVSANNMLDDEAVQGLILTARDVTERRHVEASLYEAEHRFQQVFENAAVGMNIVAPDGRFIRANRGYCEMLGYTAPHLFTKTVIDVTHPDDQEMTRAAYERLVNGEADQCQLDNRLLRPDGAYVWTHASLSAVRDADGNTRYTVGMVADTTESRELAQRLAHEATHDHLTGLASRPVLYPHVERQLALARRTGDALALLVVDLDGFKHVNDSLGHATGDAVLVEVARRLEGVVRDGDLVVRMGGDEFVLVLSPVTDLDDTLAVAQRVVESINRRIVVDGHEVAIGASVGVATARAGASTVDELISEADTAVYRAKERGRGRYDMFDDDLRRRSERRRRTETALRRAFLAEELQWVLEPVRDLATRELRGYNVRYDWSAICPDEADDEIDAVIESLGLAPSSFRRALHFACSSVAGALGAEASDCRLALNIPWRALVSSDLLADVTAELGNADVSPQQIVLGVPSRFVAGQRDQAIAAMRGLRELGVSLRLDGFGLGNASAELFDAAPVDGVVLDRDLLAGVGSDTHSDAILGATVVLARSLRLACSAANVATETQAECLVRLGCREGAGLLCGAPQPAADVIASR